MLETLVDMVRSVSGALFGGFALAEWRPLLRFVHIGSFLLWAGPAMGASWYVYVAAWQRSRDPDNEELLRRERWVRHHFNLVVAVEHLGFAVLIVSGLMLAEGVDWAFAGQAWFGWKLAMVFLVFIPMELLDVVLSAWFGRAMKPGSTDAEGEGAGAEYGRAARSQDLFLRATIPPVMIGIPFVLYLAVVRPM